MVCTIADRDGSFSRHRWSLKRVVLPGTPQSGLRSFETLYQSLVFGRKKTVSGTVVYPDFVDIHLF
jgi:hypothetical protein